MGQGDSKEEWRHQVDQELSKATPESFETACSELNAYVAKYDPAPVFSYAFGSKKLLWRLDLKIFVNRVRDVAPPTFWHSQCHAALFHICTLLGCEHEMALGIVVAQARCAFT